MNKSLLSVLLLASGMSAGCGPEQKVELQNKDLGYCIMHHPVTWTTIGYTCVEDQNNTADTYMADGESVRIDAVPYSGTDFGVGSATFVCDVAYGGIRQSSAYCRAGPGSTF